MRRLDPERWAAVYETPVARGRELVFRRGGELAVKACLARSRRGERWLDVGCGTGHLAAELAGAGRVVTGVDSDSEMLRAAGARFGDRVRFVEARAEALPFDGETFDGVLASSVAGAVDAPAPVLAELQRVLRPGCPAVLTFTNSASLLHAASALGRGRCSSPLVIPARRYSAAEAGELLRAAGLEVEEIRYYNVFLCTERRVFPPQELAVRLERRLRGRALARLGRNILVAGRRPSMV